MSVSEPDKMNTAELVQGRLIDISAHGARFLIGRSLAVGSRIEIEVALPGGQKEVTRIRFQGSVLRSEHCDEVAVCFPEPGRFLRSDSEEPIPPEE